MSERLPDESAHALARIVAMNLKPHIVNALKDTIRCHGPITEQWIGSAVKRINSNIRSARRNMLRTPCLGCEGGCR